MLKEFKEFAMRGNVIDLAIALIIGAAFGRIVQSLVDDVLMPPLGLLIDNVDFSNLFMTLGPQEFESLADAQAAGAATLNYGLFINTIVQFLLVAFAVFILVKQINRLKRSPAQADEPSTKECPFCFSGIAVKATRCPHCTSEIAA